MNICVSLIHMEVKKEASKKSNEDHSKSHMMIKLQIAHLGIKEYM